MQHRRADRSPTLSGRKPPKAHNRRGGKKNLFSDKRTRRFSFVWPLIILLVVLASVAVYTVFDNGIVRADSELITIPGLDKAYEGFTILHISDLHGKRFGPGQQQLLNAIKNRSYDIVCITGDMVAADGDPYPFYELLEGLDPTKPIYFIAGDEDPLAVTSEPGLSNEVLAEFILGAQRRGAIYVDAPVKTQVKGRNVWIAPESLFVLDIAAAKSSYQVQLELDLNGGNAHLDSVKARMRALRYYQEMITRAEEAMAEMTRNDLCIALTHYPVQENNTLWQQGSSNSAQQGVDLTLAGHFNGGQVRLPLVGPLYIPAEGADRGGFFPGDGAVKGVSQVNGVLQYISSGLGVAQIYPYKFRLFNSPSVTFIQLTAVL